MVKYFIDKGFDINSFSKNGNFPIGWAVWISDLDTIKFLVEKLGAKMSDRNIADAEKQGCKRILEYLKAYKS